MLSQAVGGYAVSRKNSSNGKICYSCSPQAEKEGTFLCRAVSLAFLATAGKAKVTSLGERDRHPGVLMAVSQPEAKGMGGLSGDEHKLCKIQCLLHVWKNQDEKAFEDHV